MECGKRAIKPEVIENVSVCGTKARGQPEAQYGAVVTIGGVHAPEYQVLKSWGRKKYMVEASLGNFGFVAVVLIKVLRRVGWQTVQ